MQAFEHVLVNTAKRVTSQPEAQRLIKSVDKGYTKGRRGAQKELYKTLINHNAFSSVTGGDNAFMDQVLYATRNVMGDVQLMKKINEHVTEVQKENFRNMGSISASDMIVPPGDQTDEVAPKESQPNTNLFHRLWVQAKNIFRSWFGISPTESKENQRREDESMKIQNAATFFAVLTQTILNVVYSAVPKKVQKAFLDDFIVWVKRC